MVGRMSYTDEGGGELRLLARLEQQLLLAQRTIVGRIDTIGILAVACYAPFVLRDHISIRRLILWSLLVALTTVGWSSLIPTRAESRGVVPVWLSCAVWALLPWMAWQGLTGTSASLVAWMLATVCGYGLATDALLLPQTFQLRVYPLMFSYLASYLAAFALTGHWYQVGGLAILALHLGAGIWGFENIKQRLLVNQATVEAEAFRDPLTALGSRGAAIREIERRLKTDEQVHCIVVDIDDFKAINTHLGHHGGDAALIAVADALRTRLKGWYVARLGGDEFIAINRRGLHPSEEGAITTIDVGRVGTTRGRRIIGLSIGASSTDRSGSPDQLLTEASAALRRAKSLGKRRMIVADDELRSDEHDRQDLAARAHVALQNGDIIAWAQPIFELGDARPVGVELLARWPQPDGRIEMPGTFVPVIEAQGLGSLLGERMLRQAIELLREFDANGKDEAFVSLNLPALVLLETDLPARIATLLSNANIRPCRLIIEMTESQRLPETNQAHQAIDRLRAIGVGIATDDLGAGWSSINQMMQRPFTHVKIDRTLTTSKLQGAEELLHALCTLADGAGQIPVAEGIETREDLHRARRAGFRHGQGFLLARPAPLADVVESMSTSSDRPIVDVSQPIELDENDNERPPEPGDRPLNVMP